MRHVLCAHLRHWPIDRLCRRRPELRRKALVLIETIANRHTVVHVSPKTPAEIFPGMALAEARARHATLLDLPATPAAATGVAPCAAGTEVVIWKLFGSEDAGPAK